MLSDYKYVFYHGNGLYTLITWGDTSPPLPPYPQVGVIPRGA
jgi:hypothetical protein